MTTTLTLLTMLALTGPIARPVSQLTPQPGAAVTIPHCLVSVIDDVQVPAQESGLLQAVNAEDGTLVKKNDLLAQIDDRAPKLQRYAAEVEREAALAKASDDVEVRLAEASLEVAQADVAASEKINADSPGLVPATEYRKLKMMRKRAELQIDKSKLDLSVAKMTADVHDAAVKAADDTIERRRILSPMDGVVLARLKQTGEWVNAGEPVLRVIRMDALRVEGLLPAADVNPAEVHGQPVRVEVDIARGQRAQFTGRVTHISPVVTAGNKYRVRAEVVNRLDNQQWQLRPGMSAVMTIGVETSPQR